jgi:hypothetical protein
MATAVFSEALDNFQRSTQLIPESRSCKLAYKHVWIFVIGTLRITSMTSDAILNSPQIEVLWIFSGFPSLPDKLSLQF